ncbi:DUF5658 family protein [Niallia sp. NCCP-28]|uniref:DUF5658 family protein n=1 Tax=Niallia sp. NCCP-28 TaxID=2934712 RepID=UPI0035CEBADB
MKFLFLLLSFLNGADAIFTYIGLRYNLILEANPLMNNLWILSPSLFLFCKLFLSFLLIALAFFFTTKNRRNWYVILSIPLCFYFFILMSHISWVILFISA